MVYEIAFSFLQKPNVNQAISILFNITYRRGRTVAATACVAQCNRTEKNRMLEKATFLPCHATTLYTLKCLHLYTFLIRKSYSRDTIRYDIFTIFISFFGSSTFSLYNFALSFAAAVAVEWILSIQKLSSCSCIILLISLRCVLHLNSFDLVSLFAAMHHHHKLWFITIPVQSGLLIQTELLLVSSYFSSSNLLIFFVN